MLTRVSGKSDWLRLGRYDVKTKQGVELAPTASVEISVTPILPGSKLPINLRFSVNGGENQRRSLQFKLGKGEMLIEEMIPYIEEKLLSPNEVVGFAQMIRDKRLGEATGLLNQEMRTSIVSVLSKRFNGSQVVILGNSTVRGKTRFCVKLDLVFGTSDFRSFVFHADPDAVKPYLV